MAEVSHLESAEISGHSDGIEGAKAIAMAGKVNKVFNFQNI